MKDADARYILHYEVDGCYVKTKRRALGYSLSIWLSKKNKAGSSILIVEEVVQIDNLGSGIEHSVAHLHFNQSVQYDYIDIWSITLLLWTETFQESKEYQYRWFSGGKTRCSSRNYLLCLLNPLTRMQLCLFSFSQKFNLLLLLLFEIFAY